MASLDEVLSSNARIPTSLPPGLVAVFAGATTGIGEATLKAFVKYAVEPKIYLLARTPSVAEGVIAECKKINPGATYVIVYADLSSMRQTDRACKEITSKETAVNLLCWSAGEILGFPVSKTPEGLNNFFAVAYFARILTIQHLLPLIQEASKTSPLARILNIAGGTKEGEIDTTDIAAFHVSIPRMRPHFASMITFIMEKFAEQAPTVSIIHDYPGSVPTPLYDDVRGFLGYFLRFMKFLVVTFVRGLFLIYPEESGERHVYFLTNGRYPPKEGKATGLSLKDTEKVVKGSDVETGSGVYSIDWNGEGPNLKSTKILDRMRQEGTRELAWRHAIESIEKAKATVGNSGN